MRFSTKPAVVVGLVTAFFLGRTGVGQTTVPATAPARGTQTAPAATGRGAAAAVESAVIPVLSAGSQAKHKAFLERGKTGNIDIVFLGDSITEQFSTGAAGAPGGAVVNNGVEAWNKYWVPLKAVNFGVSGDRTQNVLGRIDAGELDGFKAKCIVLMLGTNNLSTNRNTNEETLAGLKLVVADIRKHQPDAKLLIMGILPRGTGNDRVKVINAELAKWADDKSVFFMDIFDKFMNPDGTQKADIMNGTIHLNAKGYEVWSQAIVGKVKELIAAP
jgi:lysophospholipase L1-like esterase